MTTDAEAKEARIRAMWLRYLNGESLAQVGAAFGVRPQTVHQAFRLRGWKRRTFREAALVSDDAAGHQRLLAALVRIRVACHAIGCQPADLDQTFAELPEDEQAALRGAAKRDLVRLLTTTTARTPRA